jgi:hypothetical protein
MRRITLVCFLLAFAMISEQKNFSQDAPSGQQSSKPQSVAPTQPSHFYRLDFAVEEVGADAKPMNSRTYSTMVGTDVRDIMSIRTNSRIRIAPGADASGKENTQFQLVDLAANFDARDVHEIGRQLSFYMTADLSGPTALNDPSGRQSVVRQNRWQGFVLIPTGKPTVVFSSESLDSKGSTRILVTATSIQ